MIPLRFPRHARVQRKNQRLAREAGANRLIIRKASERLVMLDRTRQKAMTVKMKMTTTDLLCHKLVQGEAAHKRDLLSQLCKILS